MTVAPSHRGWITPGTIQQHLRTGKWRWVCHYSCIDKVYSRWFDDRDTCEDAWHEHTDAHMPSNGRILHAMGYGRLGPRPKGRSA